MAIFTLNEIARATGGEAFGDGDMKLRGVSIDSRNLRGGELVHIGQVVIMQGGSIDVFIEMVFNYPTLSEMFKYAAYDALGHFKK